MPVIQFTRTPDGQYPFASDELLCAMVFPGDTEMSKVARATIMLNRMARHGEGVIPVDASLLRTALNGPGLQVVRKRISERVVRGQIAGEILIGALAMHARGEQPRVGVTQLALADELRRYQTLGGRTETCSLSGIEKAWSEYRPVAHYWAAANKALDQELAAGQECARSLPYFMEMRPDVVIAVAMDFLRRAQGVMLPDGNGPKPILDLAVAWVPGERFPLPPVQRGGLQG
jgi:hypothetical protein